MPAPEEAISGERNRIYLFAVENGIVFPHMVVPLFVGREKSIASLEEAMAGGKDVLLSAQKLAKTNDPKPNDIFAVGTIGTAAQLLRLRWHRQSAHRRQESCTHHAVP